MLVMAISARPSMGRVSDRIGRRIPIILGCILFAVALATIPHITDSTTLIVLLVASGFGFPIVTASTSPLMSDIAPNEIVGTSIGFLDSTMDIGQTIGGFVRLSFCFKSQLCRFLPCICRSVAFRLCSVCIFRCANASGQANCSKPS